MVLKKSTRKMKTMFSVSALRPTQLNNYKMMMARRTKKKRWIEMKRTMMMTAKKGMTA